MIGSTIVDVQRQSLELVTDVQDRMVSANRELAESFNSMFESLPLPDVKLPYMVDYKLIDQAFDISVEWLQASRTFTHDMVAAWLPEDAPKAEAPKTQAPKAKASTKK